MAVRKPIVAGSFYPGSPQSCHSQIEECLARASAAVGPVGAKAVGAIVPHAGWAYSGAVAAAAFQAVKQTREPAGFVLFGAVHRIAGTTAVMYHRGAWETPIGQVEIDAELAEAVLAAGDLVSAEPGPHHQEHSLEVQVPFIQKLFAGAKILPIMVSPGPRAAEVGRQVARGVQACSAEVVFVGSTDLTHYGPRYGFTPQGTGPEALRWAKQVNDQRILDLIHGLESDRIVEETAGHHNACGGGAIAATLAACQLVGATRADLLWHTTSAEVMGQSYGPLEDSVGYAAIILS